MSDAELDAEILSRAPASVGEMDYSVLSDDELDKLILEKVETTTEKSDRPVEAFAQGFGNAASFGYLPQIQAATEPVIQGVMDYFGGDNTDEKLKAQGFKFEEQPQDSYVQRRDKYIQNQEALSKENPGSYMTGAVGGALTSGIATGGGLSKFLGGAGDALKLTGRLGEIGNRFGQAVGNGLVTGAIANPGDVEGEVSPLQLRERGDNALKGAAIGAVTQAGGEIIGSASRAIKNSPAVMDKLSRFSSFKSLGASKKDFAKEFGKDAHGEIGQTLLDKGIVKAGQSLDEMLPKIQSEKDVAGKAIGEIMKNSDDFVKNPNVLPFGKKRLLEQTQLNGKKLADIAQARIGKSFKNNLDNSQVKDRVENILNNLKASDEISILDLQDMKIGLDEAIDWSKSAREATIIQDQIRTVRGVLDKALKNRVNAIGRASGDPATITRLKDANKMYGQMATAERIAKNKLASDNANRWFSLTDTIVGTGAGAAIGEVNSPEDLVKKGLYGVAGAIANRTGRRYGLPTVAKTAQSLGKMLQTPANMAKFGEPLIEAAKHSPAKFNAVMASFMNDPEFIKQTEKLNNVNTYRGPARGDK